MQPLGTCTLMLQLVRFDIEITDLLNRGDFEVGDHVSDLDVVGDAVLATRDLLSNLVGLTPSSHHFSRGRLLLLHLCLQEAERLVYKLPLRDHSL